MDELEDQVIAGNITRTRKELAEWREQARKQAEKEAADGVSNILEWIRIHRKLDL